MIDFVTLNVKKRGIYNVLVLPEKIVVKLAKEERRYSVTNLLFLPRKVYDLQFDDQNLSLRYVYPSGEKVGSVKIKLPKPVVFERDRRDQYSILKFYKPEDYEVLKKEVHIREIDELYIALIHLCVVLIEHR